MLWAAAIIISAAQFGVLEVFRVYFMPFLWYVTHIR